MIEGFRRVTFIDDGMEVYWVKRRGEHKMLLCRVACAMGNTARVVNELHGVDTWADVDELYIKREDEKEHLATFRETEET